MFLETILFYLAGEGGNLHVSPENGGFPGGIMTPHDTGPKWHGVKCMGSIVASLIVYFLVSIDLPWKNPPNLPQMVLSNLTAALRDLGKPIFFGSVLYTFLQLLDFRCLALR